VLQSLFPFESTEDVYVRVFRTLKPRTKPPEFKVRFYPYANLDSRIRLEEGHHRILVKVSDQLEQAPLSVHEALAHVLLAKLFRKRIDPDQDRRYREFVNRSEVRQQALAVRRRRGRKQMGSPQGVHHDLDAMFDDLSNRFFEGRLAKPKLGWSTRGSRRLLGHFDPAHESIVLSRLLDSPAMPAFVVEYVLYHEMLHVKHPVEYRTQRRCVHTPAFKREEKTFPRYEEANLFLKKW
jgi:hypothetical protein